MNDCRTCAHNAYVAIRDCGWICCAHPKTLAKMPKFEAGDPAFVNFMTGDVPIGQLFNMGDCCTYEPVIAAE